jgi:hypothetical protein
VAWTKAAIQKRRVTVGRQVAKVCTPHNPPREAVEVAEAEVAVPAVVAVVEDKEGRI